MFEGVPDFVLSSKLVEFFINFEVCSVALGV